MYIAARPKTICRITLYPHDRGRDHLANERTYLAWTRTGMATMGFGVVIAKFRFLFTTEALRAPNAGIIHASDIGFVFTVVGLLIVMLSAWRFVIVRKQIRSKSYRSSYYFVLALSSLVTTLQG